MPRHNTPSLARPVRQFIQFCAVTASIVLATGCNSAPVLAPTPHVMLGDAGRAHFDALPARLQTTEIPILYWTDRADEREAGAAEPVYGPGRSDTTYFGVATIAPKDTDLT